MKYGLGSLKGVKVYKTGGKIMSGRMFGKRWHGLWEGVKTAKELKKRMGVAKRYWASVKAVPVTPAGGGGWNIYVWGHKRK